MWGPQDTSLLHHRTLRLNAIACVVNIFPFCYLPPVHREKFPFSATWQVPLPLFNFDSPTFILHVSIVHFSLKRISFPFLMISIYLSKEQRLGPPQRLTRINSPHKYDVHSLAPPPPFSFRLFRQGPRKQRIRECIQASLAFDPYF